MLVGNKGNLADTGEIQREVQMAEAAALASKNGLLFMETNATSSLKTRMVFMALAEEMQAKSKRVKKPKQEIAVPEGGPAVD